MVLFYIFLVFLVSYPVLGSVFYCKKNISGIILSLILGIVAYYFGKIIPLIGGPVFGIVLGIIVSFWKRPIYFNLGIKITAKKLLQSAIILMGFQMNLINVVKVGGQSLIVMLSTLTVCFLTAYFVNKWLKIPSKTAILVAVGTCICGGSAIAATSPVIDANEEEVATAISTIFLFNILAALIFPIIGRAMGMTDIGFGIWAGTSINDTSSVVAASYSFSDKAGLIATIVKLTRTLLIIPITFILAIYRSKKQVPKNRAFSISEIFPWFILGFIGACLINSTGFLPIEMTDFMGKSGKFMIIVAMSAIGLNTDLPMLIKNGKKPLIMGGICWFMISVMSIVVQNIVGLV